MTIIVVFRFCVPEGKRTDPPDLKIERFMRAVKDKLSSCDAGLNYQTDYYDLIIHVAAEEVDEAMRQALRLYSQTRLLRRNYSVNLPLIGFWASTEEQFDRNYHPDPLPA